MYTLIFPQSYKKIEKRFFKKHPNLIDRYEKILTLLMQNPFHPSLRIHKLNPPLEQFYSISLTMKYRIIIDFVIKDNEIIFLNIGTHEKVYKG
ncbi:MAG: plasmid stabilization protein [Epsilonproteobacteria bacterium]|nr:plasmid stabilization protein [Campylobacterota bacterium]